MYTPHMYTALPPVLILPVLILPVWNEYYLRNVTELLLLLLR